MYRSSLLSTHDAGEGRGLLAHFLHAASGVNGAVGIGLVLRFGQYWSIQYQVVLNWLQYWSIQYQVVLPSGLKVSMVPV